MRTVGLRDFPPMRGGPSRALLCPHTTSNADRRSRSHRLPRAQNQPDIAQRRRRAVSTLLIPISTKAGRIRVPRPHPRLLLPFLVTSTRRPGPRSRRLPRAQNQPDIAQRRRRAVSKLLIPIGTKAGRNRAPRPHPRLLFPFLEAFPQRPAPRSRPPPRPNTPEIRPEIAQWPPAAGRYQSI